MTVIADQLKVGDYIFIDSPHVPDFMNRRWVEIEGFTLHRKPKAQVPRMGKPMATWMERTFRIDDILFHKTKEEVETELPRIVSLQQMFRDKRAEWIQKMKSEKQMAMQDLPKEETLPHIDLLRKVILKRTRINWEFGLIRMEEELVQELADLFKGGDSSGKRE
ncbi:hypothetical protein 0305phi8-36p068 [Bacillus phage 0305phi8-36]|uniref:hypothetical protein n=1 Tax=Bacillus phage 0305phi8-36 TaxID=458639 RepID=UPI00015A1FA0|nr:hypothetical protein ST0305phi8-36p068 [Bacillus phage 0305phi8-36]ABS83628.1 hypothetical protein 0305phi8-36p068 [Bacillus phage 0305phi8-36]